MVRYRSQSYSAAYVGPLALSLVTLIALTGCGGADMGSGARSNSFDSGLTGSYSGYGGSGSSLRSQQTSLGGGRGAYPRMETSFELSDTKGNPFDYTENDVVVVLTRPDGQTAKIPAYYDGAKTWRVRFTPDMTGRYLLAKVLLNGHEVQPDKLEKRDFEVSGAAEPGFIRIDPRDNKRFAFDNGNSYYPIGNNMAWGDITSTFDKMNKVGANWSRVWMCAWDGNNLDWVSGKKINPGSVDLDVAKRWDSIVDAAAKDGIYFQLVLQHHGQYTTTTNPNWDDNPWNKKNGGFLSTPDEFFTNPRAIALTKSKYRYIIARWGYSPHILAWELFNEVEWTDSINHKHADEVAAWHATMAAFLRQQDPNHHLITTSSRMDIPGLYKEMDYYQPHNYPSDLLAAVGSLDVRKSDKPIFYGEIGPSEGLERDNGSSLHTVLWGSMMSDTSGAAQYWAWETLNTNNLWSHIEAATQFARQSSMISKRGLQSTAVAVDTRSCGPLSFGPGAGWETCKQTEYTVLPSGAVQGIGKMPGFLQGKAHAEMFPSVTFHVTYTEPGTFAVQLSQISQGGGAIDISVDATPVAHKEFGAGNADRLVNETVEAKVAAGAHTVTVKNTGPDWVVVKRFTLSPYSPTIRAIAKSTKDYGLLWLVNSAGQGASQGKVTFPAMQTGSYRVTWWDTYAGKPLNEETVDTQDGKLTLVTPSIDKDVAAWITKSGAANAKRPDKVAANKRKTPTK